MDAFHWAGLGVGTLIALAALALAPRQGLTSMHVIVVAIGAVLAGVPVISLTFGAAPSVQIGQLQQAAAKANDATQTQSQTIGVLNDRVTQLASLVSKIPVSAATSPGAPTQVAPPPVASAGSPSVSKPVVLTPEALQAWTHDVTAFRQSGQKVLTLNARSQAETSLSDRALNR